MSWAGSEPGDVYLGPSAAGWCRADGAVHWTPATDDELRGGFARVAHGRRRPRARVWLSGHWARPFVVPPVQGMRGLDEARALAQARAPDATGLDEPCSVWLETPRAGAATLAVAVPVQALQRLQDGAQAAGLRLQSVRPWWALALDQALAREPAVDMCVCEDTDALTLLAGRGDAWMAAETHLPATQDGQLQALVARRTLGLGLASPAVWHARLQRGQAPDGRGWPPANGVLLP